MTQAVNGAEARKLPWGRIALLVAALIAAFAVGLTIMRKSGDSTPAATASDAALAPQSIEALELRSKSEPDNVSVWRQLATAYFVAERYTDAAGAYEKASAIEPNNAVIWSALGEARAMASGSDVPPPAVEAFQRALKLDPKDPRSRYFLAVKRDLTGDHEGAVGDWLALLADTPSDAVWHDNLVRTIEQIGKINKIDVAARIAAAQAKAPKPTTPPQMAQMPMAAQGIPGPTAQDLQAATAMAPSEQREMAEGMVSRLEGKLKAQPKNPEGWVMLMRSRMTLNQPDKASQALRDAIAANPDKADLLREQAGVLGVK
ncbi:tetratricopeptide repeat protein [Novosphingobium sp. JCM 18896]|uniref:tetratricopeptide repeat protein n=1 Tax=Novosphingobium sp. JCM 18896 TaxID=2989731 RepID=UPI002222C289|nr:tetratricopeptide repeat protein [Novosphingobium sp. JCM 18896]MCW1429072.1 tetratricopeptide repeat protein [Novosphingobium sp. JCM 18896]